MEFKIPGAPSSKKAKEIVENTATSSDTEPPPVQDAVPPVKREFPPPLTDLTPPADAFWFEVIKNGTLVEKIQINKSRFILGRAPDADIVLEHPSISRYHAVILWAPPDSNHPYGSVQLLDLKSSHGTFVNKTQLAGNKITRIDPGNSCIKFGFSTRIFMLMGTILDEEDDEPEVPTQSVKSTAERPKPREPKNVCTWGITEDVPEGDNEEAEEVEELSTPDRVLKILESMKQSEAALNQATRLPGAEDLDKTTNEESYSADPVKVMKKWFEQEGFEYEHHVDELHQKYVCHLELPIESQDIRVEGEAMPRKKDAIHAACLRACRLLDRAELLFPWQVQNSAANRRRKAREEDEDDADMIDETRELKAASRSIKIDSKSGVQTVETLEAKYQELTKQIEELEAKMETYNVIARQEAEQKSADQSSSLLDSLESFMETIKSNTRVTLSTADKIEKSKLKYRIADLQKECGRVARLIQIAKPSFKMPQLKNHALEAKKSEIQKPDSKPETEIQELETKKSETRLETEVSKPETNPTPKGIDLKPEVKPREAQEKLTVRLAQKRPQPSKAVLEAFGDEEAQPVKRQVLLKKKNVTPLPGGYSGARDTSEKELKKQSEESDFVEWVPPVNQTGDGTTHLNQKYGY